MNDTTTAPVEDPKIADLFRRIWATAETIPDDDDEQIKTAARFIQALMPHHLHAPMLVALMGVHMDVTGSRWSLFDEVDEATYEVEVQAIRILADEIVRQGRACHALTELIVEEICDRQANQEQA